MVNPLALMIFPQCVGVRPRTLPLLLEQDQEVLGSNLELHGFVVTVGAKVGSLADMLRDFRTDAMMMWLRMTDVKKDESGNNTRDSSGL